MLHLTITAVGFFFGRHGERAAPSLCRSGLQAPAVVREGGREDRRLLRGAQGAEHGGRGEQLPKAGQEEEDTGVV